LLIGVMASRYKAATGFLKIAKPSHLIASW